MKQFYFALFNQVIHQIQQQICMSQTLQGDYYEASRDGYSNRGKETIKFTAKVNHLPVHSRCNMLLKSEEHPMKIQPAQKLETVHCYHSAQLLKNKCSSVDNYQKFSNNVSLINKPNLPKIYRQNITNPEERMQKSVDNQNENPQRVQRKSFQNHARRSSRSQSRQLMTSSVNQIRPSNHEITTEKKQYVKNPLKNTFSPTSNQYSPEEVKSIDQQEQNKIKIRPKKMDNPQDVSRQDEDECITQHGVYEPHKSNHKVNMQLKHMQEQKLLGQLSNLLKKVSKLEEKIKKTEEQFTIKTLSNQMNKSTAKLSELNAQNLRLKSMHSLGHKCSGCGCKRNNLAQNQGFLYFIIFMIGILFTKAALC